MTRRTDLVIHYISVIHSNLQRGRTSNYHNFFGPPGQSFPEFSPSTGIPLAHGSSLFPPALGSASAQLVFFADPG